MQKSGTQFMVYLPHWMIMISTTLSSPHQKLYYSSNYKLVVAVAGTIIPCLFSLFPAVRSLKRDQLFRRIDVSAGHIEGDVLPQFYFQSTDTDRPRGDLTSQCINQNHRTNQIRGMFFLRRQTYKLICHVLPDEDSHFSKRDTDGQISVIRKCRRSGRPPDLNEQQCLFTCMIKKNKHRNWKESQRKQPRNVYI